MNAKKSRFPEKKSVIIEFSGKMDMDSINEIKKEILDEFIENKEIIINLDKVTDLELPVIQLLYSAYKTAVKKKIGLLIKWKNNEIVKRKIILMLLFSGRFKAKRGNE